jgi:hypothetical protein
MIIPNLRLIDNAYSTIIINTLHNFFSNFTFRQSSKFELSMLITYKYVGWDILVPNLYERRRYAPDNEYLQWCC